MEGSSSSSETAVQQLWGGWTTLMNRLQNDPMVAQVMNTRVGQYLSSHPFFALTVLLFGAMAALPVGFFLTFALVTIIMAAVGFVFFEGFLLFVGGVTLLCVLSGMALFSVLASVILNALYIIVYNFLKRYCPQLTKKSQMQGEESQDQTKEMQ